MRTGSRSWFIVVLILGLGSGWSSDSNAARRHAPEIQEYLKGVKEARKAEAKQEREAIRADPSRKARPYQTLDEVYAELDRVVAERPELFSGGVYGQSVEGRDLRWVRLRTGSGDKPELLVSGNIHAQELAAGQMVMALIQYFADNYGKDCRATSLADSVDLYFIPVLNPDRMAKAVQMQARLGVTGFIRKNAHGVDLNRNFPYPAAAPEKLKDSAGSPRKLSQTHRGPQPLSEPETRALMDFIEQRRFILSLNYHTSGGLILYVPGTFPDAQADTELMKEMALAYQARQFEPYRVEPGIDLYPTLGDLDEYLYHRLGILAFTVEVGKDLEKSALIPRHGSFSPVFWAYNVYYLDREKMNNVPGALALLEFGVKVFQEPGRRKWQADKELWVGEPARGISPSQIPPGDD